MRLHRPRRAAEQDLKPNSLVHLAYLVTIAIKGIDGAIETILGLLIWITGPARFNAFLLRFTAPELVENPAPRGFTEFLHNAAAQLMNSSISFIVFYLLVHGILKVLLALVLLTGGGRWVYPVATFILTGFVGFMSFHLAERWSNWVLAFAIFDFVTLLLVLNEWRNERTLHLRHQPPLHF
jgi:uncharacterized membrane protein